MYYTWLTHLLSFASLFDLLKIYFSEWTVRSGITVCDVKWRRTSMPSKIPMHWVTNNLLEQFKLNQGGSTNQLKHWSIHAQAERLREGIARLEQSTKGFLLERAILLRLMLMTVLICCWSWCWWLIHGEFEERKTSAKQPRMREVEGRRCLSCRRGIERGCGFQLLSPVCLHIWSS